MRLKNIIFALLTISLSVIMAYFVLDRENMIVSVHYDVLGRVTRYGSVAELLAMLLVNFFIELNLLSFE